MVQVGGYERRAPTRHVDTANARASDPETSHEAADAITLDRLAQRQRDVLDVLAQGAQTYDQLVHNYGVNQRDANVRRHLVDQSPQSIRSRCAELRAHGLVMKFGRALSDLGNAATVWTLTDTGHDLARSLF